MSKPAINPEDILRVLRERGPSTNKEIRIALGLPERVGGDRFRSPYFVSGLIGEALQRMKADGQVKPKRAGSPLWMTTGTLTLTAVIPEAELSLFSENLKALGGRVLP